MSDQSDNSKLPDDSSSSKSSGDEDVRDELENIKLSDFAEPDKKSTVKPEKDRTIPHTRESCTTEDQVQSPSDKKERKIEAGNLKSSVDVSSVTSIRRNILTADDSEINVEPSRIVQVSSKSVTDSNLPKEMSSDVPSEFVPAIVIHPISQLQMGTSSDDKNEPLIEDQSADHDQEQVQVEEKGTSGNLGGPSNKYRSTILDKTDVLERQSKDKNSNSPQDQSVSEEENAIAVQVQSDVQGNIDSLYKEILKVDFKTMLVPYFEDEEENKLKVAAASADTLDDVSDLTSYEDVPTDSEGRPLPRPRSILLYSDSIECRSIPEEPGCLSDSEFSTLSIPYSASESEEIKPSTPFPEQSTSGEQQRKASAIKIESRLGSQSMKADESQRKAEIPLSRLRQDTMLSEAFFQERNKWLQAAAEKDTKVEKPKDTDQSLEQSEPDSSVAFHHRDDWLQAAGPSDVQHGTNKSDEPKGESLKGSESDSSAAFHQRDQWLIAAGGDNQPGGSSTDEHASSLQAQSESDSSSALQKRHKWLQRVHVPKVSSSENEESSPNPKSSDGSASMDLDTTSGEALGQTTSIESSSFESETTSGEPLGKTSESHEEVGEVSQEDGVDPNLMEIEGSSGEHQEGTSGEPLGKTSESPEVVGEVSQEDGVDPYLKELEGSSKNPSEKPEDKHREVIALETAKKPNDDDPVEDGKADPSTTENQGTSGQVMDSAANQEIIHPPSYGGNRSISLEIDRRESIRQESPQEGASHQHDLQMPSTSRGRASTFSYSRDSSSSSGSVQSPRQKIKKRISDRMKDTSEIKRVKSSEGLQRTPPRRLKRRGSVGSISPIQSSEGLQRTPPGHLKRRGSVGSNSPSPARRRRKIMKKLKLCKTSSEHAEDLDSSDHEEGKDDILKK